MLVLTRKVGETIVIDNDITVTVLSVRRDKIRLGVVAPVSIRVDRLEVRDRRCASGFWHTPTKQEQPPKQRRAIVFDLDNTSLASLRKSLLGWKIEVVKGATALSLARNWNPGRADLLVLGVSEDNAELLALCRFLAFCRSYSKNFRPDEDALGQLRKNSKAVTRADASILVLVRPGQDALVQAALRAGAHSCLVLPIHHKDVTSVLDRAAEANQPGRHTTNLQHAQCEDLRRDDGGEG